MWCAANTLTRPNPPMIDLVVAAAVYGNTAAVKHWQMQTAPDCVEQTIRIVTDELASPVSESAVDGYAQRNGWYDPSVGTSGLYWPTVLAHFGVAHSEEGYHSLATVKRDLREGRRVVVVLDGPRVWDLFGYSTPVDTGAADHAVVLDEVTASSVVLTDTGVPTGATEVAPLSVFKSAWSTSGYLTVSAWR